MRGVRDANLASLVNATLIVPVCGLLAEQFGTSWGGAAVVAPLIHRPPAVPRSLQEYTVPLHASRISCEICVTFRGNRDVVTGLCFAVCCTQFESGSTEKVTSL